jgi:hypothetical protein
MIETRRNFSRRILIRLLVLGVIVAGILFVNYGYINDLYLKNQLTPVGLVINSLHERGIRAGSVCSSVQR